MSGVDINYTAGSYIIHVAEAKLMMVALMGCRGRRPALLALILFEMFHLIDFEIIALRHALLALKLYFNDGH